jgi:signal transduction histidine kinase
MPASNAVIGPMGIVLVILNTALSMGLLSGLILLEQKHFDAVEALADSERRMRHSQKMAAIGQLSQKVSHGFMNALTAILGHAQVAKDRAEGSPDIQKHMDGIIETVGRVSHLSGELLAFANPAPLRVRRMDLSRCTVGIREILAKAIGPGIDVVVESDTKVGDVDYDPNQIEQAIVHMAVNAAEAMAGSGRLTISVSRADLSREEAARLQAGTHEGDRHKGPFAVITMRDTGCGMSEETSARVFEPFFTTKTEQGNVGLGLSTVYSIVQMHNGFIDIDSQPGRGATFCIYLPIVNDPPQ